jgi:short subunit dehydrogenase-like uncharacterized protein
VSERDLEVVVFGAGGVTGRHVAAHLAERAAETGTRWAAAARNPEKAARALAAAGVGRSDVIAADISDAESLRALAARTRVVLDLVGPYTLYGRPVIEACLEGGAHYVDLTGEIPFVRDVIDSFDADARQAGVKIVQVCGFEALPADLGTALAAHTARERWDEALAEVDAAVTVTPPPGLPRPSDMISGGTLQSLLAVAAGEHADSITDPAVLVVEDAAAAEAIRRTSPITLAPRLGAGTAVIAPMAPAPFINPAVIHRTAVLEDLAAGRTPAPFRYREGVLLAGGPVTLPLRAGAAAAISGTQVGLRALARAGAPVRRSVVQAVARVAPGSGYGPAADRLEGWTWELTVDARSAGGHDVRVRVDAEGHPGYLATARMLAEAGILLAQDGATPAGGGCVTPALALGAGSAEHFAHARVRFSVGS